MVTDKKSLRPRLLDWSRSQFPSGEADSLFIQIPGRCLLPGNTFIFIKPELLVGSEFFGFSDTQSPISHYRGEGRTKKEGN